MRVVRVLVALFSKSYVAYMRHRRNKLRPGDWVVSLVKDRDEPMLFVNGPDFAGDIVVQCREFIGKNLTHKYVKLVAVRKTECPDWAKED